MENPKPRVEIWNPALKGRERRLRRERIRGLNAKKRRSAHSRRFERFRSDILLMMGGRCARCGFSDIRALQVDHIDNDGAKDPMRSKGGKQYLRWVLNHPDKYQLLCANCNRIKYYESIWGPPRRGR